MYDFLVLSEVHALVYKIFWNGCNATYGLKEGARGGGQFNSRPTINESEKANKRKRGEGGVKTNPDFGGDSIIYNVGLGPELPIGIEKGKS